MHHFPPAFQTFIAPARSKSELWRTLVGLCLIAAIYSGFSAAVLFGAQTLFGHFDVNGLTARSMLIFFTTFIGMAVAPMLVVRFLHHRMATSLFGPAPRAIRDFMQAVLIVAIIFSLNLAVWIYFFDAMPNVNWFAWLQLLPIALVAVFIQTGAEELVFRGYLQQQLAARFASPIAWLILPTLLFAAAHYDPESYGANLWPILIAICIFGFAAADLTACTGSLGAAWGFHFANNVVAILLISVDGPLTGLALFKTPYSAVDPVMTWLLVGDVFTVILAWAILRRALKR